MTLVLDASVVLAYLLGEPGGDVLEREGDDFLLSSVNLTEVLTRIVDRGLSVDDVIGVLRHKPIAIVDYGRDDALLAVALRLDTRQAGLSLGDRACLALAKSSTLPVLTADTAWSGLSLGIDIRFIR